MMNKIAAAAIAGTLAVAAMGAGALPAAAQNAQDDGGRWYNPNQGGPNQGGRPGNNDGRWNNPNRGPGNFGAGALFGFGLGTAFGQPGWWGNPYPPQGYRPPPRPPVAYYPRPPMPSYPPAYPRPPVYGSGWSAHVAWCQARYRTYNPATNTYFIRIGVPAVCNSPYA